MPPSKKVKCSKKVSKSSILKYFTSDVETKIQNGTSSSSTGNENHNSNIGSQCKSNSKRRAEYSSPHEKPKKCKLLNVEPIVISSSDDGESESNVPVRNSMNKVLAPIRNIVEPNRETDEDSDKIIDQEILISQFDLLPDQETDTKDAKIQASLCLQKHASLHNKSLESVRPIEAKITAPQQCSMDDEDGGKIAWYHLNFCQVLDTVLGNDDDRALFDKSDDMTWIDKFKNLPLPAQKLYVRLYHRKVAWLREEQIHYPGIARNIKAVLECLMISGFLLSLERSSAADLNLDQVLKLLPSPSLKDLARSFKVSVTGLQKKDIRSEICKMCRQQRSLFHGFMPSKSRSGKVGLEGNVMKRALKALGACYKVATDPRKAFNRVLLVFDVTRGLDDELDCTLTGSKNALGQGRHLQLSAILMAGMGKVCYPQFRVNRVTSIFKRRADLLQYETAFQFQMDVMACVESGKWDDASLLCENANKVKMDMTSNDPQSADYCKNLPEFLRSFSAQWVYTRLRSLEVEVLQRLKNYSKAVDILRELLNQKVYCQSRRGHWWERLALNVDQHLKDPVKSMNIIHESLKDSKVRVGHKLALAERANKILASKAVKKSPQLSNLYKEKLGPVIAKLDIQHAPVVEITGCLLPAELQTGKARFVNEVPDYGGLGDSSSTVLCSVEELALSHYRSIGFPYGIHGEGGTFSTLFCLFLWDIIFMDGIPDVFRTSCQTHPLDYHTDGFYMEREQSIEQRLKDISDINDADFQTEDEDFGHESSTSCIDVFTSTWDMEYGKACSGMDWERFSNLDEALGLIRCIGGKVLAGIFRRLAKDIRHTRSGLPDLVVWNPASRIYKLVEVKGPGDRLSTNQKLWIDELLSLEANVEVCKVIAIGGKKVSRD